MSHHHPISLPKQVELEPAEQPVVLVRQHWYVFRDPILIALFIPFLALSGIFFLDFSDWPLNIKETLGNALLIAAGVAFLLGLLLFLWKLYLWRRTFYLVTNKRLVLLTQHSLFHSDDRECSLAMIQDVKAEIKGLQPALYGFGDVTVQVSGQDARLVLERVGHPHAIQHSIMREAHLR